MMKKQQYGEDVLTPLAIFFFLLLGGVIIMVLSPTNEYQRDMFIAGLVTTIVFGIPFISAVVFGILDRAEYKRNIGASSQKPQE